MNIYICEEYESIKEGLIDRGHNIVEDNTTTCDALLCNLKNCDITAINSFVNLKREGAIIIDCGSKSVDDIDYILNNRSYSSIL